MWTGILKRAVLFTKVITSEIHHSVAGIYICSGGCFGGRPTSQRKLQHVKSAELYIESLLKAGDKLLGQSDLVR